MLCLIKPMWKHLIQRQPACKNALSQLSRKLTLSRKVLKKPKKRWGKLFPWPLKTNPRLNLLLSASAEIRVNVILFLFLFQGLCKINQSSLFCLFQPLHPKHWNSERHQKHWKCCPGSPKWPEHSVRCFKQNE